MDLKSIVETLLSFAFHYPLFMSYVWIIAGSYYYFRREYGESHDLPLLPEYPPLSILVPCHNEQDNLIETIGQLMKQTYPNFDVIAINDCSTDKTGEMLDELTEKYPNLRVVHLATNQGKAMGLRMGALVSNSDYLLCIDGDALLDPGVATWMMSHLVSSPRVGAVTGNPRIRNRSTLLGKLQVGEFSSIIGLIKRAQRIYGRVFTLSGVIGCFRKSALHRIDYWNTDMITEDIDVSWRLQLDHWDIRYEPNALCWILMPETIKGLWKQRLRWSQGGAEVILRYFKRMFNWRARYMWPVYLEYLISVIWSYCMLLIFILWFLKFFIEIEAIKNIEISMIIPGQSGILLGVTCLLQFMVSLMIDSHYERGLVRYIFFLIWYPLAYWLLNMTTCVVAFPKAIFKKKGRAVWTSPDRGIGSVKPP